MTTDPLLLRAKGLKDELVLIRRDLHRYPELAFGEQRTAEKGRAYLAALGLDVQAKVAGTTGVVATLESGQPGPTLVIRADMDALPIAESTGLDFSSRNAGVMHACGHDAHVTCALGAAKLLVENKAQLRGRILIVLQPAEETPPGGAQVLIEQGRILHGVDAAIALHCHPGIPAGTLAFRSGQMLAHSDRFLITLKGKGAHAARPHLSVDAVAVAVQVYQALQYLVSRENDPLHPFVLTIGRIAGGVAANVISETATLEGTTRSLDERVAEEVPERMKRIIGGICHAARAEFEFQYERGYPALVNDPGLTEQALGSARGLLGAGSVRSLEHAEMGGEDFAYFARKVPATMFRLGVGNAARGWEHSLHSPRFTLDEDALPIGAAALARIALDYTANGKAK
jgi:amidohydrolase